MSTGQARILEARRTRSAPVERDRSLEDHRFRALVSAEDWARLPAPVRARFSARLQPGGALTFVGEIVESRRSLAGALIAQLARLIGAPLPLRDDIDMPAVVTVTEDLGNGGQFWTRVYGRSDRFPQVIHSSKRFSGPTGLEEYLGAGFGVALCVAADDHALHFRSHHYFLDLRVVRFRLPAWLAPGALTISHVEKGAGLFAFVLQLRHPLFGELVHQIALFHERQAQPAEYTP
jgi:hypothetical protein